MTDALDKRDFETLSEFRYQLRRFLRFSEEAAQAQGVTPQQYLLMLHTQGFDGRDWATVGELAERLQMVPHGAVALVKRCEALTLVQRRRGDQDRREVQVSLTAKGFEVLEKLAFVHRQELKSAGRRLRVPFRP
ncbi:transcriptional regulator, MarR family protein [Pseudomonas sp. M47T1]|uniref:MarR family winged helix-turn-helix transcriptional regulator n=1 Tax=Pseudomonas sp. M47T1 TaxID=1179778 RepID=UPI0002607FCC|nr:MarR family winged helix-turn-helix transcriptional regulator [Pseudomonas sp. M47T1]EIK97216.1 transcriptional regulator, MarR family protein [Pseudomonas sp. M47T1]